MGLAIMRSTFAFLGLELPGAMAGNFSARQRFNPTAKYPEMAETTRRALRRFFAPHMKLLREFLDGADLLFPHFRGNFSA